MKKNWLIINFFILSTLFLPQFSLSNESNVEQWAEEALKLSETNKTLKIAVILLDDEDFWVRPSAFLLLAEMEKYRDNLDNSFGIFEKCIENQIPEIAGAAARAFAYLGDKRAIPLLLEKLNRNGDAFFQGSILTALGKLGDEKIGLIIIDYLNGVCSSLDSVVEIGLRSLGDIGGKEATDFIINFLKCTKRNKKFNLFDRNPAIRALGNIGSKESIDALKLIFYDAEEDWTTRAAAAEELGRDHKYGGNQAIRERLKIETNKNLRAHIRMVIKYYQDLKYEGKDAHK